MLVVPTLSSQLPAGRHRQEQRTAAQERRHQNHATVRRHHPRPDGIQHFRRTIVDAGNSIHEHGNRLGRYGQDGVLPVCLTCGTDAQRRLAEKCT